jgi:chemotaxis protein MotB
MARKRRDTPKHKKDNSERWLLTYSDMITLLMVFFIVLFAMSNPSQAKNQEMSEAFANIFGNAQWTPFVSSSGSGAGVLTGVTAGQRVASNRGGKAQGTGGKSLTRVNAVSSLQNLIKAGKVTVVPTENGFAISLASDLYFGSASAALGQDAMPVLQQVADFLGQIPNSVVVEGYTDTIRPDAQKWPDNWHLAAARSLAVLNTLEDYGIPSERLSSESFGEQRPVQSNDTAEGRAYNRRVDIVIVEQQ